MMSYRIQLLAAAATLLLPMVAGAQKPASFDRRVPPPVPPPAPFHVPAWTQSTLPNGARLVVSERHTLPLVSVTIAFNGGAAQYEPADKTGVASFTAAMLTEGTTLHTGDQLSEALQLLGTGISAGVSDDAGSVGFVVTRDKLPRALTLLAEVIEHPTFPDSALDRLRARTLVALQQQRVQGPVIADKVFGRVVYGTEHPYGRATTEQTVKAITRSDIVAFHGAYFTPSHAIVTVVGDVDSASIGSVIEHALAGWTASAQPVAYTFPTLPPATSTTIYLIDKPEAAQSSFALGLPGPPRATPDYFALEVLNTLLGGLFQSRLNANIREQHGYSYGVGSDFAFGKGPGAFRAGGEVVSAKTDSALLEFMRELRGVHGERPFTTEEIRQAKDALVQRMPRSFGSVRGIGALVDEIYLDSLPADFYQTYAANVNAVTSDDLLRVANKYIDLNHLSIVIVGDAAKIEGPLKATHVAPIVRLDADGKPVPAM
jgi:zinc protease